VNPREHAEQMARRLSAKPVPDQLKMAAEMVEQAELPEASHVHRQSMLSLAHALLDRITTDIAARLAAKGMISQPKLKLPEEKKSKKAKGDW
jgi:hypothetical protein